MIRAFVERASEDTMKLITRIRTFVRSTHFKKEADGAKWDPQPCIVRW